MKKTGLKTFIYSFVFSLFAIFTVNGVFFRTNNNQEQTLKMPSKNISSFLRAEKATSVAKTAKNKHIALHIPSDKQLKVTDVIPLTFDKQAERKRKAIDNRPLISVAKNAKKENIVIEAAVEPPPPPQQLASAVDRKVLYSGQNNLEAPPLPLEQRDNIQIPEQVEIVQVEEPSEAPSDNTVLAQKDDVLLIPLEKTSGGVLASDGNIQIVKDKDETQIAMAPGDILVKNVQAETPKEQAEQDSSEENPWQTMADRKSEDSPWVVAKGTKHPRNRAILEEDYNKDMSEAEIRSALSGEPAVKAGDEVQVAEMVKNILIPIPDEIMNDQNLTPQLISPNKTDEAGNIISEDAVINTTENGALTEETPEMSAKDKSLLKSLSSIFSGHSNNRGQKKDSAFFDQLTKKASPEDKSSEPVKILPTEMRLAFQPNRAEISGHTLKWIQAFAKKANEDRAVILEIRIDGTSAFALQQKRLNLLYNILNNKGVEPHKVNIVFTAREPNSFILRTLRINENEEGGIKGNKNQNTANLYYQQW